MTSDTKLLRECREALQESIENEGRLASFADIIKRIDAALLHRGDAVSVPRIPTTAMIEAGRKAMEQQDPVRVSHARVMWVWNDMLAAHKDANG